MNSEYNSIPSESMDSDKMKELYKKTPLKKRPIQPISLSPEEKKISPKPRACTVPEGRLSKRKCTVPEGRLSKRKMLKPTKKIIDSHVGSPAVIEPAPKAMVVPVIKTSESKASFPVERNKKAVNSAMVSAVPELKKTCGKAEVPSRSPKSTSSRVTYQEFCDFKFAVKLQKEEFGLRERLPRRTSPDFSIKTSSGKSVKAGHASAENMDIDYTSPKMPKEVDKKQGKKAAKRKPRQTAVTNGEGQKIAFAGSHAKTVYNLSPELANIVGHRQMTAGTIIDAMHYVFLERNLFDSEKTFVSCDDELSETLFAGKRHLRFDEVKNYLCKHVTLSE